MNPTHQRKRQRRVELMIDQRLLSFMKPISASPTHGPRRRDSMEFIVPSSLREPPTDCDQNRAS